MANSPFVQTIVEKKIPCYFISPHLDDAVLSAGDLIAYLGGKTDVYVVTIFSAISAKPYTLSTRAFLRQCGYSDAEKFIADRKSEDRAVLTSLGVTFTHLDFIDASWRKRKITNRIISFFSKWVPELGHLYPVHRLHIKSGNIAVEDTVLMRDIVRALTSLVGGKEQFLIFCPYAVGTHIDHVITRKACEEAFGAVILWLDVPYHRTGLALQSESDATMFVFDTDKKKKIGSILGYATQAKLMYPDGIVSLEPEIFSVPCRLGEKYFPDSHTAFPTVTVGIPAYNEENNIGSLMGDVLRQKQSGFILEKIIVYSDGNTDATPDIVRNIHDPRVELLESDTRQGLSRGLNAICDRTTSDILVVLNADIAICGEQFIENLVRPIVLGRADLVSGSLNAIDPTSIFERILFVSTKYKKSVFERYNAGVNMYTCHGPLRAFSRKLYTKMRFKPNVTDDMYSYLFCRYYGYRYAYASNAVALYKLPGTLSDHIKQSLRFFKSPETLTSDFDQQFITGEHAIPLSLSLTIGIRYVLRYPLSMILYLSMTLYIKARSLYSSENTFSDMWEISPSTKVLKK